MDDKLIYIHNDDKQNKLLGWLLVGMFGQILVWIDHNSLKVKFLNQWIT